MPKKIQKSPPKSPKSTAKSQNPVHMSAKPAPEIVWEKNFSIVSLGCPKNLIDSETMLGRLEKEGYTFERDSQRYELVLLNTCGFLDIAREEAQDSIRHLLSLKKKKKIKRIVVTGCMVQHGSRSLMKKFPGIDAWVGVFEEDRIAEIVRGLNDKPQFVRGERSIINLDDSLRHPLTEPHVAYLKIADGCNRHCSYCSIPSIRGKFVSKPQTAIIEEAKRLADSGVRELILIAQETNFWGGDLEGKPVLADLLDSLQKLGGQNGGFKWIRVMYTYPMNFTDELISKFGSTENGCTVLPYIDLPLQHANDMILKSMNRRVLRAETEELLGKLRERVESLVLRSSFIVGFPGETDEMFAELLEFVQKWKFERAGVFAYSPESGTAAFEMDGRVSNITSEWRHKKLYAALEENARSFAESRKGKILDLIIDHPERDENDRTIPDLYLGRSYAESPDNDPVVYVTSEKPITDRIISCEIVDLSGIDLVAVPVNS